MEPDKNELKSANTKDDLLPKSVDVQSASTKDDLSLDIKGSQSTNEEVRLGDEKVSSANTEDLSLDIMESQSESPKVKSANTEDDLLSESKEGQSTNEKILLESEKVQSANIEDNLLLDTKKSQSTKFKDLPLSSKEVQSKNPADLLLETKKSQSACSKDLFVGSKEDDSASSKDLLLDSEKSHSANTKDLFVGSKKDESENPKDLLMEGGKSQSSSTKTLLLDSGESQLANSKDLLLKSGENQSASTKELLLDSGESQSASTKNLLVCNIEDKSSSSENLLLDNEKSQSASTKDLIVGNKEDKSASSKDLLLDSGESQSASTKDSIVGSKEDGSASSKDLLLSNEKSLSANTKDVVVGIKEDKTASSKDLLLGSGKSQSASTKNLIVGSKEDESASSKDLLLNSEKSKSAGIEDLLEGSKEDKSASIKDLVLESEESQSASTKDLLKKIVEDIDISDDELEEEEKIPEKLDNADKEVFESSASREEKQSLTKASGNTDNVHKVVNIDVDENKTKEEADRVNNTQSEKPNQTDDKTKDLNHTQSEKPNQTDDKTKDLNASSTNPQPNLEASSCTHSEKISQIDDSEPESERITPKNTQIKSCEKSTNVEDPCTKTNTMTTINSPEDEETIENIRNQVALIREESSLNKTTKEKNLTGVFVAVNTLETQDNIEDKTVTNPLEIPQVILDQLDLKKFSNLAINKDGNKTITSENVIEPITAEPKKPITAEPKKPITATPKKPITATPKRPLRSNTPSEKTLSQNKVISKDAKLIEELQRRIERRKAKRIQESGDNVENDSDETVKTKNNIENKKEKKVEETKTPETEQKVTRGRPRKTPIPMKPSPNALKTPISTTKKPIISVKSKDQLIAKRSIEKVSRDEPVAAKKANIEKLSKDESAAVKKANAEKVNTDALVAKKTSAEKVSKDTLSAKKANAEKGSKDAFSAKKATTEKVSKDAFSAKKSNADKVSKDVLSAKKATAEKGSKGELIARKTSTEKRTDLESESDTDLLVSSRPSRIIKLTDKYRKFVAQEKHIKLSDSDSEDAEASLRWKPKIQIKNIAELRRDTTKSPVRKVVETPKIRINAVLKTDTKKTAPVKTQPKSRGRRKELLTDSETETGNETENEIPSKKISPASKRLQKEHEIIEILDEENDKAAANQTKVPTRADKRKQPISVIRLDDDDLETFNKNKPTEKKKPVSITPIPNTSIVTRTAEKRRYVPIAPKPTPTPVAKPTPTAKPSPIAKPTPKPKPASPVKNKRIRKELISASELSESEDDFELGDDEDRDPDFSLESDSNSDGSESLSSINTSGKPEKEEEPRTVYQLMEDVFKFMPSWNIHVLPHSNSVCMAQIARGVNGIPMLKKCIEMDSYFNVKVFVHQIHYKKFDGIYDSEDHFVQLLQQVDSM